MGVGCYPSRVVRLRGVGSSLAESIEPQFLLSPSSCKTAGWSVLSTITARPFCRRSPHSQAALLTIANRVARSARRSCRRHGRRGEEPSWFDSPVARSARSSRSKSLRATRWRVVRPLPTIRLPAVVTGAPDSPQEGLCRARQALSCLSRGRPYKGWLW